MSGWLNIMDMSKEDIQNTLLAINGKTQKELFLESVKEPEEYDDEDEEPLEED